MNEEELKSRVVCDIDISRDTVPPEKYKAATDPTLYHSRKLDRGPLHAGWATGANPIMTAYKRVTMDFPYWGFQSRIESAIEKYARALSWLPSGV